MASIRHHWRTNLDVTALTVQSDDPPVWEPHVTVHRRLQGRAVATSLPGLHRTGTLRVWCGDHAARDRILALVYYGDPLHLTDVCGPNRLDDYWFAPLRVTADKSRPDRDGLWLDIEYARVDSPTSDVPVPWTYSDLAASAATYTAGLAPYSTYDALWFGPVPTAPDPAAVWGV